MTSLEKSLGVLGTELLFKNTFFNGESLEAFKKTAAKNIGGQKKNVLTLKYNDLTLKNFIHSSICLSKKNERF
jgi:hypothetical protein